MRTEEGMWKRVELERDYYNWLTAKIPGWRDAYPELISRLYATPFRVTLLQDENRVADGLSLRSRYAWEKGLDRLAQDILKACRPCGILELMLAMSIRCEEEYLASPSEDEPLGSAWFGPMVHSLGLAHQTGPFYDEHSVDLTLRMFMDHQYRPDGFGSLFWIRGTTEDLRKMELWRQMMLWIEQKKQEEQK